jgi:uncharacterized protein YndB with AHSA1/START domain
MADSTYASTTIDAPPGEVLAVIADVESYPRWAGGVKEAEVRTRGADGRPEQARFSLDSGPIKDTYVLAYTWAVRPDGTGTVSWRLAEAQVITRLDGQYELGATDGGGTEVTYRLAVDVRIPMLGMLKRKAEKVIIDTALKGLRTRVEG